MAMRLSLLALLGLSFADDLSLLQTDQPKSAPARLYVADRPGAFSASIQEKAMKHLQYFKGHGKKAVLVRFDNPAKEGGRDNVAKWEKWTPKTDDDRFTLSWQQDSRKAHIADIAQQNEGGVEWSIIFAGEKGRWSLKNTKPLQWDDERPEKEIQKTVEENGWAWQFALDSNNQHRQGNRRHGLFVYAANDEWMVDPALQIYGEVWETGRPVMEGNFPKARYSIKDIVRVAFSILKERGEDTTKTTVIEVGIHPNDITVEGEAYTPDALKERAAAARSWLPSILRG